MLADLAAEAAAIFTEDRSERRRHNRAQRALRQAGRRRWWAPWTRHPHPTTPPTSNR